MINKKKFWIIFAIVSVLVMVLILYAYVWVYDRLDLVNKGHARPTFPYSRYSQEELNKMYPQYVNVNVVTTQTPEETHKIFIEKLKAQDIDGAVECCFVRGDWGKMKDLFVDVREKKYWDIMIKDLDTKIDINPSLSWETRAVYSYTAVSDGGEYGHNLNFIKNNQGVWLMEAL